MGLGLVDVDDFALDVMMDLVHDLVNRSGPSMGVVKETASRDGRPFHVVA